MSLQVVYEVVAGEFERAMKDRSVAVSKAATAAMKDAAGQVKVRARARIGAAGFGIRWQNALRVVVYPRRGFSPSPATWVFHKIPYAAIFEDGGTIARGRLLWLPLPAAPARIGRRRTTPRIYEQEVGPLRLVKGKGRPLLVADIKLGKRTIASGRRSFPVATLRRQASRSARGVRVAVPMFFGISPVKIRARFNIRQISAEARDELARLYFQHLSPDA